MLILGIAAYTFLPPAAQAGYPSTFALNTYYSHPVVANAIQVVLLRENNELGVYRKYERLSPTDYGADIIRDNEWLSPTGNIPGHAELHYEDLSNEPATDYRNELSYITRFSKENGSYSMVLRSGNTTVKADYDFNINADWSWDIYPPAVMGVGKAKFFGTFYCWSLRGCSDPWGSANDAISADPTSWTTFYFLYPGAVTNNFSGEIFGSVLNDMGKPVCAGSCPGNYTYLRTTTAGPLWPNYPIKKLVIDDFKRIYTLEGITDGWTNDYGQPIEFDEMSLFPEALSLTSHLVHATVNGSDMFSVTGSCVGVSCDGYQLGEDYRLINGYIDWSPPGREPAPGTSYRVSYTANPAAIPTGHYTRPAPAEFPDINAVLARNRLPAISPRLLDGTDWGMALEWTDTSTGEKRWGVFDYALYGRVTLAGSSPHGVLGLRVRHIRDSRDYPFDHPAYPYATKYRTPDGAIAHNITDPDMFENAIDADGYFVINQLGGKKLIAGTYEITVLVDGEPVWGPVEVTTWNPEINIILPPLTGIQKDLNYAQDTNLGNGSWLAACIARIR